MFHLDYVSCFLTGLARIRPAIQHRTAMGTSQKAPTITRRPCTVVKHHVAKVSISLILGGIASLALAKVASHPEWSSSREAAVPQDQHIRNIVLVHGAWADGSGWRGVYDILVRDGFNVSIVQEPETSFQDDVAAVKRILALQDGPCILVAHSYGGAVITEAGTGPSVAGLVYIAAHMPDAGENEADDGKRFPSDLSRSGAVGRRQTDSRTSIPPSSVSTLRLICLRSRPLSWPDRRYPTRRTISRRSSLRLRGEANQVGWWWRQKTEPLTLTLNAGTPRVLIAIRPKSQAPATRYTCRTRRKSQM